MKVGQNLRYKMGVLSTRGMASKRHERVPDSNPHQQRSHQLPCALLTTAPAMADQPHAPTAPVGASAGSPLVPAGKQLSPLPEQEAAPTTNDPVADIEQLNRAQNATIGRTSAFMTRQAERSHMTGLSPIEEMRIAQQELRAKAASQLVSKELIPASFVQTLDSRRNPLVYRANADPEQLPKSHHHTRHAPQTQEQVESACQAVRYHQRAPR
jgi:hypothetical protein